MVNINVLYPNSFFLRVFSEQPILKVHHKLLPAAYPQGDCLLLYNCETNAFIFNLPWVNQG